MKVSLERNTLANGVKSRLIIIEPQPLALKFTINKTNSTDTREQT